MTLDTLRNRAAYSVALAAFAVCSSVLVAEFALQGGFGSGTVLAAASLAALAATGLVARRSGAFRLTAVSVLMAEVVALLIATRGHPFQVDIHMAFFAGLALCALMYDIRAILLGAALVAVHHLALGLMLPELVFYGGSDFGRIVLHAVILIVEAAGLVWMTMNTKSLMRLADAKSSEAAEEASKVTQLADDVKRQQAAHNSAREVMLNRLDMSFGEVVARATAGDFGGRVPEDFDEDVLRRLAGGVNAMVATVERGIGETGEVLAALADTDLTRRVSGSYQGAFAQLKNSTNAVAVRLTEIVGGLRTTSRALRTATGEILAGANDLSERTTKQAAMIEETSAAMEALAGTVVRNAERAREASEVAGSVTRTAEESGEVMSKANLAMERISASSAKISNIIGLIDDVAFQTNLLALNASVEAARAGEAGKGFAVVAVEVRRLAQSAAQASSEVKVLIEQSGTEVKGGSRLVADAAAKLEAMLGAARSSSEMMGNVARESREQAGAIDEVNTAVRQMDEMTQHNAALVEQTNAAIEQTEAQASELDRVVDIFRLEAAAPASAAPESRPTGGIHALQDKVRGAARAYLSRGNAVAKAEDWAEF